MGRRGNGEGTIYRRKDGTWAAQIVVGRKPDGSLDRRTVYGKTRAEVAEKLAKLQAARSSGTLAPPTKLTVGEYLRAWLEHHTRFGGKDGAGLRPNTVRNYRTLIEKHIAPPTPFSIGHIPLAKLTPDHLKRLYEGLDQQAQERAKRLKRPPSKRMAEMAHNLLHKAFQDAVTEGRLPYNPGDRVANPPRTRYRAEDRPALDKETARKVLDAVRDTRYYLPFLTAMATGLRRGEVLGLTWEHVAFDFPGTEFGAVLVRQQWNRKDDGTWGLVPLKTKVSERDVPMSEELRNALVAHLVTQKAEYGERWTPKTLVFDRGDGRPIPPEQMDAAWSRVRKNLHLPATMRLHDLRGSYITWLAEQGVNPKAAAALAGHADPKVTWAIYQRVTQEMVKGAARAVAGLTGGQTNVPPEQSEA